MNPLAIAEKWTVSNIKECDIFEGYNYNTESTNVSDPQATHNHNNGRME